MHGTYITITAQQIVQDARYAHYNNCTTNCTRCCYYCYCTSSSNERAVWHLKCIATFVTIYQSELITIFSCEDSQHSCWYFHVTTYTVPVQSWPTCERLICAPQADQILSTVLCCTVVTILTWAAFHNLQKLCNTNISRWFTNASRTMSSSFQVSTHTHVIADSRLLWCGPALMGKFHIQSWPILGPHLLYTQACQHPVFTHHNSFNLLPPLA